MHKCPTCIHAINSKVIIFEANVILMLFLCVGTLNFKVRLDEADRINQMNLRLATRLETVKPNYTKKEYKTVVAIKPKIKLNLKYSPLPQLSNYHARDYNYHSPMVNDAANGFYCRTDESASRTVEVQHIVTPELRKHNKNSAKSMTIKPKILLEFTTVQYGRAIDTVVIKEPFKDRYAVFGIDVLSGQRYELHFTSEEIFNVLESDMLVTSVEDERVWHALLHKVDFEPIEQFTKIKSRNSASPLAHQRKIERNPQYNEINGENFSVMEGSVTDYFDFYQETTDFQLSNQNDNNERYESQIENSANHEENYNVRQNENDTKYEDNFDVRGMMDPRSDQSGITDPRSRHVVQHLQQLREEESSVISTLDDEYYPDFDSDTFEVVNENVNYNTRDEMKYTRDGLNRQDDNFNSEDEEDFVEDYRNRQIIDKGRVERASPAPVSVAHRTKVM